MIFLPLIKRVIRVSACIAFALYGTIVICAIYTVRHTSLGHMEAISSAVLNKASLFRVTDQTSAADLVKSCLSGDVHETNYCGIFDHSGRVLSGNLARLPLNLLPNGLPQEVVFEPTGREWQFHDAETAIGVMLPLSDGRIAVLGIGTQGAYSYRQLAFIFVESCILPVLVLSIMGGIFYVYRQEKRVAGATAAVDQIRHGNLGQRFPAGRQDGEVGRILGAANSMLDFIQSLVFDLRGISECIAHDLRNPLTRARVRLERSLSRPSADGQVTEVVESAVHEIDHALGIITAVLRIGQVEHVAKYNLPVAVADMLNCVAELYVPVAEAASVTVDLACEAQLFIRGDRSLLMEALCNLVDNAIKYTANGSVVRISAARTGTSVVMRVADQGCGIPHDQRERVLRRFYRLEQTRSIPGTGLGLSLVDAVVRRHGFELSIGDANPGCVFEIKCPALIDRELAAPDNLLTPSPISA